MDTIEPSPSKEILELIGSIVLATQEVERHLKFVLPFTDSQDPSLGGALARREKLEKVTLGSLVGQFVDASKSDSPNFAQHLATLVEKRNQIVHQFGETYGEQLRSGDSQQVISLLRAHLANVKSLGATLEQLVLRLSEAMRDITFRDTPEQKSMCDLCEAFRERVAR
jgi:hypothetical protein